MPERYALYLHFGTRRAHDRKKIGLAAGGETNQKRRARAGIKNRVEHTPSHTIVTVHRSQCTVAHGGINQRQDQERVLCGFHSQTTFAQFRDTHSAPCVRSTHLRRLRRVRRAVVVDSWTHTHALTHARLVLCVARLVFLSRTQEGSGAPGRSVETQTVCAVARFVRCAGGVFVLLRRNAKRQTLSYYNILMFRINTTHAFRLRVENEPSQSHHLPQRELIGSQIP